MNKGLLIINLGTPNTPNVRAVHSFLREFLADPRVIDLPAIWRFILLYGLILPFRTHQTAQAYQSIWTKNGSPLLQHSVSLVEKVQKKLGKNYKVALGMRYGQPSIEKALRELRTCATVTVLPLYPQYSSAATGSSIEKVMTLLAPKKILPSLNIIRDFYKHPSYLSAMRDLIKPHVAQHDYVLFSYHGLPESHLLSSVCEKICNDECPVTAAERGCYRAQCFHNTDLLAKSLELLPTHYGTAFQSRVGKKAWIKPYTEEILIQLYQQGVRRLAVSCPSFVADCLETLEEIGIRAKNKWHDLGGEKFTLIPSLNASNPWVDAIVTLIDTPLPPG